MERDRERARERIGQLAHGGLDVVSFWREATDVLARAVPFDWYPCWFTLDPTSLLVTSHFNADIPALDPAVFKNEYVDEDFNKLADVALAPEAVTTLLRATGGDPNRSPRYRELLKPYGLDQELIAAFRTDHACWGAVTLYREPGRPEFETEEMRFLAGVAPYFAEGARRGLLFAAASEDDGPEAPGLLVLDAHGNVDSVTPAAEQWLDELPDGSFASEGKLPSAVLAVAAQALRSARGDDPGRIAVARVLARSGSWLVLHGASLIGERSARAAVIIEPAHPARIISLLMKAYALSDREEDVTRLVLQGNSTSEIATKLFISSHTVQDHLKSIFEKTGVRSRRELSGKIFFAHYEPRVRDNEKRVIEGRMIRGGPYHDSADVKQKLLTSR